MPGAGKARLERLERSTGLVVAELAEQTELFAAPFRAELIALAGGVELPASVQMVAQLAVVAVATVKRAQLLSNAALGDWSEARLDTLACETLHERADKSQRNLAGLAIVARDLLQSARAAAKEAGAERNGAAMNPVDRLMGKLGVRTATAEVAAAPPVSTGGGGVEGAPLLSNSPPTIESK